jgi:hypothetical protein
VPPAAGDISAHTYEAELARMRGTAPVECSRTPEDGGIEPAEPEADPAPVEDSPEFEAALENLQWRTHEQLKLKQRAIVPGDI